jgi:hypothetical protein
VTSPRLRRKVDITMSPEPLSPRSPYERNVYIQNYLKCVGRIPLIKAALTTLSVTLINFMSPSGVIHTSDKDYDNGLKALHSVAKGKDRRAAKDKRIHTGVNVKNLADFRRKNLTRRNHQDEQVCLQMFFMPLGDY